MVKTVQVLTTKDGVTDSAVAVDVGMQNLGLETALRREGWEAFRHLQVQHKHPSGIRSVWWLQHVSKAIKQWQVMTHSFHHDLPERDI